ncbi:hypothetical protein [Mangrovimonas sp. TPBH4]|uniref:hypothetical protein n=1 Tax=Mangrovimonas sp. TPBH4 TaxID=1645914 RepID=UPI0006B5EC35|nr:hypothetical protein [Mangrovimonas sp. TPBH4]
MRKYKPLFIISLCLTGALLSFNCGGDDYEIPDPSPTPAKVVTINLEEQYQTISGFGGANRMWTSNYLSGEAAEKAFGLGEDQLGLSIFRDRISPNPSQWSQTVASLQAAQNHGVTLMASPWSPPANLKSNNNTVGGHLLPEYYEAYKNHLNEYLSFMAGQGVSIDAISVQNEPEIQVSYESCDWNATTMGDFIAAFGGDINASLVAPESFNFSQSFTNTLLNRPEAVANIDIVGGHIYGGGLADFPLAEQHDKPIWMTEYLMNLNTGNPDMPAWSTYSEADIWEETMEMLASMHNAMSHNWNAYIWWYIQRYYSFIGDGTEGTQAGEILKRGYAFSHYSKFVRPGYVRVGLTDQDNSGLHITAYDSPNKIVVVILNQSISTVSKIHFEIPQVSSVSAFETSALLNRESKSATITEDLKVALDLVAPKSVTTLEIIK